MELQGRILVAEDCWKEVADLIGLMKERNWEVDYVRNGRDALRVFDPALHDAVVLDWRMPIQGMDEKDVERDFYGDVVAVKMRGISPGTPIYLRSSVAEAFADELAGHYVSCVSKYDNPREIVDDIGAVFSTLVKT